MIDIPPDDSFSFKFPDGSVLDVPPITVSRVGELLKLDEGKAALSPPRRMQRTARQICLLLTPEGADKAVVRRIEAIVERLSWPQLSKIYMHLMAAASGQDVEALARIETDQAAAMTFAKYHGLICDLAAKQGVTPQLIREMLITDFNGLIKAVAKDEQARAEYVAALTNAIR